MEELANGLVVDASISPLIDSEVTAYTLFPHLVKFLVKQRAASSEGLEDILQEIAIEINVDGEGTIPDSIFREHLANHAYLPAYEFSSWLSYPNYRRYRYDNQLKYFSSRGNTLYFSEDPAPTVLEATAVTTAANNADVVFSGSLLSSVLEGQRLTVSSSISGTVLDAIVDVVDDADNLSCLAKATAAFSGVGVAVFRDASNYEVSRSLTSVATTLNSPTVTCAGGAFTAVDVGRLIHISAAGNTVIHAIIATVVNATTITLFGQALATTAVGTADIKFSPLLIETPAMPDLPTNIDDDVTLSPNLVKDVILCGAAVLRGEVPLSKIIDGYVPPDENK